MSRLYTILDKLIDRSKPVSVTASVSAVTGTLVSATASRIGDLCVLTVTGKNTSAVAPGNNIFEGTLNTTDLRPAAQATAISLYGTQPVVGLMWSGGSIHIRNVGTGNVTASAGVAETFIYVVGGGVRALKSLAACFSVGRRCVA